VEKISKDKQYKTRDGREVRIYATDGGGAYPIHGAIKRPEGWVGATWGSTGYVFSPGRGMLEDLIEVKPRMKFERWVVVFPTGACHTHLAKPDPEFLRDAFAVKHIVFEVEKGEGLE
jgi:hypothetical protein